MLGHDLIEVPELNNYDHRYNFFRCLKCNLIVAEGIYSINKDVCYITGDDISILKIYKIKEGWIPTTLTCDQIKIKALLE